MPNVKKISFVALMFVVSKTNVLSFKLCFVSKNKLKVIYMVVTMFNVPFNPSNLYLNKQVSECSFESCNKSHIDGFYIIKSKQRDLILCFNV